MADEECGAETPALFQVVLQPPFRYGSTKWETYDSWLRCRGTAFTSAAFFEEHQLFLKVGDAVSGFVECTTSKAHFGAQLTGRSKTLATERKALQPASSPTAIELNGDVIAALPQLGEFSEFPETIARV